MFWPRQDALPRPLALDTQETKRGSFYFWTGPMPDEKRRESLSEWIERQDMVPVAFLDIRNLITDEVFSIRLTKIGYEHEAS